MTDTEVWLGIDWTGGTPAARLAQPGSTSPARLVSLGGGLCFRAVKPAVKYCVGWFDLSGPEARHVVCQSWERLPKGRQCRRCQYLEGFLVAHQRYESSLAKMPPNLREYLARPHRLYVDIFADGSSKVGTVAEQRLADRLSEQGPAAACYVARTRDGLEARRLEAAASKRLELPQMVSTTRKLRGLATRVDLPALRARLNDLAARASSLVAQLAQEGAWSPIDPPEWWRPPTVSADVFAATPLSAYPSLLTAGEHSLNVRGMSGGIAVVAADASGHAVLYATNLGQLLGVELTFGEYQPSVSVNAQSALF